MIGFLRMVGILNAAIWLGGAVFFTFAASPAATSDPVRVLLGDRYFPYYSIALEHIVWSFYLRFQITCAIIAFLHVLTEWLYLGRPSRKFAFGLLTAIFLLLIVGGTAIQPRLRSLHVIRYSQSTPVAERQAAARSFRTWNAVLKVTNCFVIAGLIVYLWRATTPSDNTRFISSVKFRG